MKNVKHIEPKRVGVKIERAEPRYGQRKEDESWVGLSTIE